MSEARRTRPAIEWLQERDLAILQGLSFVYHHGSHDRPNLPFRIRPRWKRLLRNGIEYCTLHYSTELPEDAMTDNTRNPEDQDQDREESPEQSDLLISVSRIREARDRDYMTSDGQSDGGGTGKSDGPS
jgi:hypothetical protein